MMTNRYSAFIVILEQDIRSDDAEATINAIRQIKGVLDVQPHVKSIDEQIAESRVRTDIGNKLFGVVFGESK